MEECLKNKKDKQVFVFSFLWEHTNKCLIHTSVRGGGMLSKKSYKCSYIT